MGWWRWTSSLSSSSSSYSPYLMLNTNSYNKHYVYYTATKYSTACCFYTNNNVNTCSASSSSNRNRNGRNGFSVSASFGNGYTRTPLTRTSRTRTRTTGNVESSDSPVDVVVAAAAAAEDVDCLGTAQDVECIVSSRDENKQEEEEEEKRQSLNMTEVGVLVSPFFFWGTAMVAMKEVLPLAGPFFVSAFRLIPAGFLLVAYAASKARPFPSGFNAWLSITLFALVDATCFQGFLSQGLQRTSAGLGSVIIDSQPLTVAVLAALLFGESIGFVGAGGLILGVIGLLLLEVPALSLNENNFSLWGSGEWWMLLAAQSMAIGTVMVRWVSKYADPVMATGWHMVIGGLPLLVISILNHDPAFSGSLKELTTSDILALLYTSIFGSAISYGVYYYSATKGSLTKLSSLTFLTPMFASIFGFLYLGESFSPLQLVGAIVTVVGIYVVNYREDVK